MKYFISFQELDALGEGLSRDYIKKTRRWNSMCFDIEGFITDYLGLPIEYESFAEEDSSKIGFLSDGVTPLLVFRNKIPTPIVFPKDTIVVEKYLYDVKWLNLVVAVYGFAVDPHVASIGCVLDTIARSTCHVLC